jgi:HEAT repeat protein
VPYLQRAAADPDATVRRRAFDGLIEFGCQADGTLAVAVNGVVDKDFWVVLQAFQILDCQRKPERGPDRVMVELAKIVDRLDERNSDACFDFFVRRAGADAGPVVQAALKSEKRCVVLAALKAAGRLRLAGAKPEATRLAGKPDLAVAVAAIDCLSLINDPDTLPILVELLDRAREPERVDALCVALRRMTSRLYGSDVSLWRKYLDGKLK